MGLVTRTAVGAEPLPPAASERIMRAMASRTGRSRTLVGGFVAALVLPLCAGAVLSATTSSAQAAPTLECQMSAGSWAQSTPGIADTTWSITKEGFATQSNNPGGYATTGSATLSGGVLTINWTTPESGYAGVFRWTLNANCGGTGKLTFSAPESVAGDEYDSTVDGPDPVEVFPESEKVKVSGVQRKVELQRNSSGWEPAQNGVELSNGDRVHTGFKSGVVLNFPNNTRLFVGPMTLLRLTDIDSGPDGGVNVRLELKYGLVTAQVNRSTGAAGDFQVKTPTTTASVRGTTFTVAHDGTATTVVVTKGTVEVTAKNGDTVLVPAGKETRSTATTVSPPVAIGQGFTSGGLSSEKALARVNKKVAGGLKACKYDVVSNKLKPITGGWSASFTIVKAKQGIAAKPTGTAKFKLQGKKKVTGSNPLARKVISGCP